MKKIIFIAFTIIGCLSFIVWCSRQNKTIELESKAINIDAFSKKQECAKYYEEIFQAMKKEGWEDFVLFYSPKLDSCVYWRRIYDFPDPEFDIPRSVFFLADVFTRENIEFNNSEWWLWRQNKIDELKWE